MKKFRTSIFTAHLMGGCGMSENAARGVVDSRGRHHQIANLSIFDGSVFPDQHRRQPAALDLRVDGAERLGPGQDLAR